MSQRKYYSLKIIIILIVALLGYINIRDGLHFTSGFDSTSQKCTDIQNSKDLQLLSNSRTIFLQRGDYWVEPNKFLAREQYFGNDSITLSTPADFTNLDNLIVLVERWNGPISCCVFATGTDYFETLKIIRYLQECTSPKIKELVSFHFLYHKNHIPKGLRADSLRKLNKFPVKCNVKPKFGSGVETYRKVHGILFPINTARNVAREMATTHFVFPSDVELYPSEGVIPNFLKMMANQSNFKIHSSRLKVFVLPAFEVEENVTEVPSNKDDLKVLLKKNLAMPFHVNICRECHTIPYFEKWIKHSKKADVFKIVKRKGLKFWEPFYIGTKQDPGFDERFTWEGRSNKRIQAFLLCTLDYEFHVLNNAFVVHRPGIKPINDSIVSSQHVYETLRKLNSTIIPELTALYGYRKTCFV